MAKFYKCSVFFSWIWALVEARLTVIALSLLYFYRFCFCDRIFYAKHLVSSLKSSQLIQYRLFLRVRMPLLLKSIETFDRISFIYCSQVLSSSWG